MTEANPAKLAILIDAENVLPTHADLIFQSAQAMGDVIEKEIYGVAAALTTWVEPVLRYAIHPNLTIKASKGKNTSDIALVIGAMDLLLKGEVNTVVIASSDSDFSALSVRLRTAGIHVVGMGTEKSNALWRTACSSFVVLEHPAQAPKAVQQPQQQSKRQSQQSQRQAQQQPQKQPQAAQQAQHQPQQPAEAPAPQPPQKTANASHKDRAAAIQQVILKRLASNGGRVQATTLFSALNRMPEYRQDRQGSGKKPLNYLTSTFADVFDFEDSADGKIWVTVKGPAEQSAAEKPAVEVEAEATEAVEEAVETPVVEVEMPEEAPETAEGSEEETVSEPEEPAAEEFSEPSEETPAEQEADAEIEEEAQPQQDEMVNAFVERLIADGMEPETAESIARILSESDNLRTAYNNLRKVYGNAGRDYYKRAKEILTGQQG